MAAVVVVLASCLPPSGSSARLVTHDGGDATGPRAAVLPTERCGSYFLVAATLNGRGPYRLLLDTGYPRTQLTPRVARELGVRGSLGSISVGDLRVDGRTRVGVADLSTVGRALGTEIDGILGYAAFADLLLTYDYPAGEVRVAVDSIPADAPGVIPMSRGERPFLVGRMGTDTVPLVLDTGFNGGLALAGFAGLPLMDGARVVGARVRVDGVGRRLAGRLVDDLHLGPVVLRTPVVTDAAGRSLLGQEILDDYVVSLDRARGRARLVTAGGVAPTVIETPPLRGTGIVAIPGEFHLEVIEVSPGSSAEEAGIQVGDRVVEMDGVPVGDRACPSGDESAAVEPRVLTIERGAERFGLSLLPGVLVR